MKFNNVKEAFNHWNTKTVEEIETRAQEIKRLVETDSNADIETLNIEVEGIQQVQENMKDKTEKRSKIMNWNPITGTKQVEVSKDTKEIFETPEYRSAFFKDLLGQELTSPEQRAMETATEKTRVILRSFNTVTDNASVIPTETLNEVVRKAGLEGGLLAEARGFSIPANLKLPVGDAFDKAEWHTEGEEVEADKVTPTHVEFASNELLKTFSISANARKMSVSAFESYITDELANSVMRAIADSLVNGTGGKGGKGLASISFVAEENLIEYTTAPEYTDFTEALALLKRGYAKGAKFAMNNATLYRNVYGVVDGNKRPIFVADASNAGAGRILGYDVVIDDNIADGDVFLGNFKNLGYNLPDGIAVEASNQSSFKSGLIDYRALAIADTQVILPEAFVKLAVATGA